MIIAIGGASRSGKTRLAKLLKKHLIGEETLILCQDDYVYPISHIPTIRDRIDWECPESINFEFLHEDLTTGIVDYDHVIIEGFLVFHQSELFQRFDKSIFIHIDKKILIGRRMEDNRWDNEPDWYIEHIWESYLKYGQVTDEYDCLKVSGTESVAVEDILKYILVKAN